MGLGMPEVLLILVIALIVFGPRKLPELGKSMGQAMAQFRRASDDFKRTWEQEVELDNIRKTSASGSAESDHGHNSTESNDPYNPYASDPYTNGSETAQLSEPGDNGVVSPAQSSSGQFQENAETVAEAADTSASSSAKSPDKKHWI
jgi:TatA/E family protein of Tat protein translocase